MNELNSSESFAIEYNKKTKHVVQKSFEMLIHIKSVNNIPDFENGLFY